MFETENLGQHSRTSEFLCVYTFVPSLLHVCMCIYAHVHMYMWMSEPNRGYLTFFTLLFEVGSLTEPEVCGFSKVGQPHLPTTRLSLSVLGLQAHATVPSFWMWVPEITLRSLCLYGKLFADGVNFPRPKVLALFVSLYVTHSRQAHIWVRGMYTLKQTGEVYLKSTFVARCFDRQASQVNVLSSVVISEVL